MDGGGAAADGEAGPLGGGAAPAAGDGLPFCILSIFLFKRRAKKKHAFGGKLVPILGTKFGSQNGDRLFGFY